ncbi:hypothetical protein BUALT_Bualt14G0113600 [Buddleja alternifolia]|uniref:Uncharacterized protein n=1 Tax=Buddleja alternifolia TaxID=168488 RepID=A0AAV6WGY9_9LAMI|nr:hypothetical protein BUALT_Bualt14G0113600 [Buddleja alternifolia]
MSTTYFLVFLLGLVVFSTPTTADQDGATAVNHHRQKPFINRFYSRAWAKIKNHPSKTIQKPLVRASEDIGMLKSNHKPVGAEKTIQKDSPQVVQNHAHKMWRENLVARPKVVRKIDMEKIIVDEKRPEIMPNAFLPGARGTTMQKWGSNKLEDKRH